MKKRIFSLLLVFTMLLPLALSTVSAAESERLMYANYGTVSSIDGVIEDAIQLDTPADSKLASFGAAWDAANLYIGMTGVVVTDVGTTWQASDPPYLTATALPLNLAAVTLNGTTYKVDKNGTVTGGVSAAVKASETLAFEAGTTSATGSFYAEFAIPMGRLELIELGDGSLATEVELSYVDASGNWHSFGGYIILTDNKLVTSTDVAGKHSNFSTTVTARWGTGGQYVDRSTSVGFQSGNALLPAAARADDVAKSASYSNFLYTTALTANKKTVAQQDLYLTNLPIANLNTVKAEVGVAKDYASFTLESNLQNPARAIVMVGWGGGSYPANSNGYVIYNTSDGLYIGNDAATTFLKLGVGLHEWFTLRLEIAADRTAVIKVNGTAVGTLPAPNANKAFGTSTYQGCGLITGITCGTSLSGTSSTKSAQLRTRNPYVGNEDANATAALNAIKNLQFPEIIGSQIKAGASNEYSVRFLSEIKRDLDSFESIGYDFIVMNAKGQSTAEQTIEVSTVYESYMDGSNLKNAPKGGFVMTFVIRDIPIAVNEWQTFTVTPWIKAKSNGVKLLGESFTVTYINDNGTVRLAKIMDELNPERIFGLNPAMTGGKYIVNHGLNLPATIGAATGVDPVAVRWESSNEAILENNGAVHRPAGSAATVTLTAYVGEGSNALQKSYSITVQPITVTLADKDTDPYKGGDAVTGATANAVVVDGAANSIIGDLGAASRINRAMLYSTNAQTRASKNFISLYYSNDNATYTLIPEYTMQIVGKEIHFYNFDVEARYFKIHFTYIEEPDAAVAIKNTLQNALNVDYTAEPLFASAAGFAGKTTVTVSNSTAKEMRNKIVTYTLADLGIPASTMKADLSDIRFRTAGYELPHYYANGRFYVRVMNIPANGSTEITVLYGNTNAPSVSDGVATMEMEYGTKYSEKRPAGAGVAWRNSVATMPDGSLLRMGGYLKNENGDNDRTDPGESALSWERSTDGGYTWTGPNKIPGTSTADAVPVTGGGGFIVDYVNNVVFFLAYEGGNSYVFKSTDSGYNWTNLGQVTAGAITYVSGIMLTTADGAGPNVDYVFPIVKNSTHGNGLLWADYSSSLYSTDGGTTWILSETSLAIGEYPKDSNGNTSAYWTEHESGVGECTIWEKEDGTLIMYSRYQGHLNGTNNVNHFLISYSYDSGKSWKDTKVSTVRTTETQPIVKDYDDAAMLLWGGNNMLNFRSYARFPLNIAVSADDAENFIGILDITHGTTMASREDHRTTNEANINITNPDISIATYNGVEFAYIVTDMHFIVLENFRDFLYLTKGAFDSFESGSLEGEGWMAISGTKLHYFVQDTYPDPGEKGSSDYKGDYTPNAYHPGEVPTIGTTGATEGSYAMQLGSQTEISRSVPYVTNGEVFFDLYASSLAGGYTLELQSSYTNNYRGNAAKVSPMRLYIDAQGDVCYYNAAGSTVDTGLNVNMNASNSISISFNAATGTATVTVNGASASISFNAAAGAYVCFVHMRNGANTSVSIDRFGLVDYD